MESSPGRCSYLQQAMANLTTEANMKPGSVVLRSLAMMGVVGVLVGGLRDARAQVPPFVRFEMDSGADAIITVDPALGYAVAQVGPYSWLLTPPPDTKTRICTNVTAMALSMGPGVGGVELTTRCIAAPFELSTSALAMCPDGNQSTAQDGNMTNPNIRFDITFRDAAGNPTAPNAPGCDEHGRPLGNCAYRVEGTASVSIQP